ncbi:hypothetical protein O181_033921 [Austropuccinia psidii MF-1]|uniref:Uncharacterized protein n=1 Tax=Austropuccinia psidii MF-1 TaxID=1389203 RepID=A0A9Q3CZP2_9BASI|nr:hypothetical protein [Austropuccinia psidii MF-1]
MIFVGGIRLWPYHLTRLLTFTPIYHDGQAYLSRALWRLNTQKSLSRYPLACGILLLLLDPSDATKAKFRTKNPFTSDFGNFLVGRPSSQEDRIFLDMAEGNERNLDVQEEITAPTFCSSHLNSASMTIHPDVSPNQPSSMVVANARAYQTPKPLDFDLNFSPERIGESFEEHVSRCTETSHLEVRQKQQLEKELEDDFHWGSDFSGESSSSPRTQHSTHEHTSDLAEKLNSGQKCSEIPKEIVFLPETLQVKAPSYFAFLKTVEAFIKDASPKDKGTLCHPSLSEEELYQSWPTLESKKRKAESRPLSVSTRLERTRFKARKISGAMRHKLPYYGFIISGSILLNKLNLYDGEKKLLLSLYALWTTEKEILKQQQIVSDDLYNILVIVRAVDCSNKAVLVRISHLNQLFSPPLFETPQDLASAQKKGFVFLSDFWNNFDLFSRAENVEDDKLELGRLRVLLSKLEGAQAKAAPQITWIVFQNYCKHQLPLLYDAFMREAKVYKLLKEAVNTMVIQESIYHAGLEEEFEVYRSDFKLKNTLTKE